MLSQWRGSDKQITRPYQNGWRARYALVKIDEFLPKKLSLCCRGFSEWNLHGHRVNWFDFKLNIPNLRTRRSPFDSALQSTSDVFILQCNINDKSTRTKGHYTSFHSPPNFPTENMLRKWVHICTSIDVDESTITLYRDGELVSEQELDLTGLFPVGYFEESVPSPV